MASWSKCWRIYDYNIEFVRILERSVNIPQYAIYVSNYIYLCVIVLLNAIFLQFKSYFTAVLVCLNTFELDVYLIEITINTKHGLNCIFDLRNIVGTDRHLIFKLGNRGTSFKFGKMYTSAKDILDIAPYLLCGMSSISHLIFHL